MGFIAHMTATVLSATSQDSSLSVRMGYMSYSRLLDLRAEEGRIIRYVRRAQNLSHGWRSDAGSEYVNQHIRIKDVNTYIQAKTKNLRKKLLLQSPKILHQ